MNKVQKLIDLISAYEKLGIGQQIDYDKFYLYSLITHSTAIEGSTVTEIENQLLFDEGIPAKGRSMNEQLMNLDLKAAYEQSINYARNHADISVSSLKHLASVILKNTGTIYKTALGDFSSSDGDLRLLNVTAGVGGRSYMNFTKIPQKLEELCIHINERRKSLNPADVVEAYYLSFDVHFQLVTIHPWADGNGRMARLLMNQLQFEFNLLPSVINKNSKAEYIEALIATREKEDLNIFRAFMLDEHICNIELIIANYKASINDDFIPYNYDGLNDGINDVLKEDMQLTSRQEKLIKLITKKPDITVDEIAVKLKISKPTAEREIAMLKSTSYIIRIGSRKTGHWQIVK